jgi:hypothetical protein
MRNPNRWTRWALTLALLAAVSSPAAAERAAARFTVSALVPQRVSLQVLDQPALLTVSGEDVRRGYKDLSLRYEVRHNSGRGYLLNLSPRLGLASRVAVLGLDAAIELRDHGVEVYRDRPQGLEHLALTFRIVLDAAARPGRYALPVHVTAVPL